MKFKGLFLLAVALFGLLAGGCGSSLKVSVERLAVDAPSSGDTQGPDQIVAGSLGAVENYLSLLGPTALTDPQANDAARSGKAEERWGRPARGNSLPTDELPWGESEEKLDPAYAKVMRAQDEYYYHLDKVYALRAAGADDKRPELMRTPNDRALAESAKLLDESKARYIKTLADFNARQTYSDRPSVIFARILVARDKQGASSKILKDLRDGGDGLLKDLNGDKGKDVASSAKPENNSKKAGQADREELTKLIRRSKAYANRVAVFFSARREADPGFEQLYVRAKTAASGGTIGFGGFASRAVHMISPSDPRYKEVLKARVEDQAISSASTNSAGTSTVIFVQESPTQIRVYSVDADGSKLAQNILFITDKALQAAVKYAVP